MTTPNPTYTGVPISRAAFFSNFETDLISKEERAQIAAQQRRWEEVTAQLETLRPDAIAEALKATKRAYEADPSQANLERMETAERGQREFMAKSSILRSQVKRARDAIAIGCQPMLAKIFSRAAEMAEQSARSREHEQNIAEQFGIPYVPSATQLAVEQLAQTLTTEAALCAEGRASPSPPAVILAGLVKL